MTGYSRYDHRPPLTAVLLVGTLLLSSVAALAGFDGKAIVPLEAQVSPNSAVRVGYLDYGYEEIPSDELDYENSPFSRFQKRMLLALSKQEGLVFDLVGAKETGAFYAFLEDFREVERKNKSQNEYEFGSSKKSKVEQYEEYDLRSMIDWDAWNACDYEVRVKLSDWDYEEVSTGTTWNKQFWTLDTYVQSANVTLTLVDLESGQTIFVVYYHMSGDDLQEEFDEVAADFAFRLEIALWEQWIERGNR